MESTGVYWIPLFQILERRSFEVRLVNAHHVKNVPGRKTDVADCQWIQHLHSVGLLRGSFRPDDEICAIRSLWRHRDNLIQLVTLHLQHMQKALDQMNLRRFTMSSAIWMEQPVWPSWTRSWLANTIRIDWRNCGTRAFVPAKKPS